MNTFSGRLKLFAFAVLACSPILGAQSGSVTIIPANPTLLVGRTQQLTANGAVMPTAAAAGAWHTCVIFADQSVRCAGRNTLGQVGDGTFQSQSSPAVIGGLANALDVEGGAEHTCALIGDGTMKCWGTNFTGQLGDGTMGGLAGVPQPVQNITTAIKAVPGGFHTCTLLSDRTVRCWGRNQDGQVGNGDSTTDVALPQAVTGLSGVADLAAGWYHTCALMPDRTALCWGRNSRGQIGNATDTTPVPTPTPVSGLTGATALALGGYHACALLQNGSVQCWGDSDFGQVGSPGLTFSKVPATVSGIANAIAVSSGFKHSCAVLGNGTVWCWGLNDFGQLGDGTLTSSATPVRVQNIAGATAVAAGGFHTCAVMADRSVQCWGENDFGELGNGTVTNSTMPVKMDGTGLTWTSSNPSVGTVSAAGIVSAVGRGTATVTATDAFGNSGGTTLTVRSMLTLSVMRQGDGIGTVTSSPTGITCPTACESSFVSDSQVLLTAAPGVDSLFTGWTGCDSVSGATCTVTMTNARSATAIFMLKRFQLTISKTGIGKGTVTSSPVGINCGSACFSDYVINTTVTLTASPATGSIFTGWTGCDAVTGDSCTVRMTAAKSVAADFLGIPLF